MMNVKRSANRLCGGVLFVLLMCLVFFRGRWSAQHSRAEPEEVPDHLLRHLSTAEDHPGDVLQRQRHCQWDQAGQSRTRTEGRSCHDRSTGGTTGRIQLGLMLELSIQMFSALCSYWQRAWSFILIAKFFLLQNNAYVTHLDVSDNDIQTEGVTCISQMLAENSAITHLVRDVIVQRIIWCWRT